MAAEQQPQEQRPNIVKETAGQVAKGATQAGVKAGAKSIIARQGLRAATKAAFAAVGGFLSGGVSAILTFAPDAIKFVKKHAGKFVAAGVGGVLGLAATGSALAGALGAGTAGVIATIGLGGVVGLISSAFAAPVIVAMIAVPITIALIIFIINSGAYVVPPSTLGELWPPGTTSVVQSPYIQVTKRASPAGPFNNVDLPVEVEFTVEVRASLSSLNNIRFEHTCQVFQTGTSPGCEVPVPEDIPETISPTTPFVFTYRRSFGDAFRNSLVLDSFTVTADAVGAENQTSTGSAGVVIGNPPTGCFVFDDSWAGYPERQATVMYAIAQMSVARSYMAQLCSDGEITLHHNTDWQWWGGWVTAYKYIRLYPRGVESNWNAFYTLAHESGHVLAQVTDLDQAYYDSPVGNQLICTYPGNNVPSESFAEMIALYYVLDPTSSTRDFRCLGGRSFQDVYPGHWRFARDNIFLENLGWPNL